MRATWLSLLFANCVGVALLRAEDAPPLVLIQKGELPIILSAPHGGKLPIPNADVRERMGRPTGGAGFSVAHDGGTEPLALKVAATIEAKFGKKPYYVISRAHRKYLDPNRPPEIAFDDPDAKPVYDTYHKALTDACHEVQERFKRGLLLDIHGQGTSASTVYRGTQNGTTTKLLGERYGKGAVYGEASLFGRLKAGGWKVFPDPLDGQEQAGFTGGFIVRTYGSHQAIGVDAIQLEFGGNYRATDKHAEVAEVLTLAVADYAKDYLGLTVPEKPMPKPEEGKAKSEPQPSIKP